MTIMVLEWVFTSIFLILTVLTLRAALGRRMSAGLRYALWAVVLVRLLVPVQLFTSPVNGRWVVTEKRVEHQVTDGLAASAAPVNAPVDGALGLPVKDVTPNIPAPPELPDAPAAPDAPEPPDLSNPPEWLANLGWVWLAGSVAVALVFLLSNLRFYWRLRRERIPLEAVDCPLRVYVVTGLPSPCLFGVVRPAVYVTPEAAADPDMLRHVLAHEYTHYRHGDHIWSLLRCAALAVHWWNPLVWVSAVLSQRDAELACDEGALKRLGDGERAGYGNTLLALVTAKPRPGDLFRCATTMAGDKKSLKERISRIAAAPKRVVWAVVVAVLVTALACMCAFGQAEPEAVDEPEPSSSPSAPAVSERPVNDDLPVFDLSFSINERGDVAISGTVDGLTLGENTYWHPAFDAVHPITYLAMEYPPYIAGNLEAWWWDDDGRTSVMVSTSPMIRGREGADFGYWTFIVDFSEGTGVVTEMSAQAGTPAQTDSETQLRLYPEAISNEEAIATARIAAKLLTAAEDYYNNQAAAETLPLTSDLNRNGIPETIQVIGQSDIQRMEIWENGTLLFEEEGFHAHAGWTSVFLCTLDGEDYLLRYHPTMYGGVCTYDYELFTLENGAETVVRENSVEFDKNFQPWIHESFDPEAIAAFMDEVNGLLANSVQLINTDENLLGTFEKNGRLYDDLWFMDTVEGEFARDPSKSLLENLNAYQKAMEDLWDNPWDDPWGLCLTTSLATPAGVNIAFTQTGGAPTGELFYGSEYWLLREDEDGWTEMLSGKSLAWTDIAYSIPMSGQSVQEVNWSWLYGELPPGRYCICKDVIDWRAPGDYDTQTYYAPFFVE